MTLEEAIKRLRFLYRTAERSEKIKSDPLVWALHQLTALAVRSGKEKEETDEDTHNDAY